MFESGGEGLAGSTCVQIPGRVPGALRALAPPTPLPCQPDTGLRLGLSRSEDPDTTDGVSSTGRGWSAASSF